MRRRIAYYCATLFLFMLNSVLPSCHPMPVRETRWRVGLDEQLDRIGAVKDTNDISFWQARMALVKIGMPRSIVHHILPKKESSMSFGDFLKDGTETEFYWLDMHWAIKIRVDNTGSRRGDSGYDSNLLVELPKLIREDFRSFIMR